MIARGSLQPKGLDARLFDGAQLAIVTLDEAFGGDQAGRVGAEKIRLLAAVGSLQSQVEPIEAVAFEVQVAGLGIEVAVIDLGIEIQVSLGGTGQNSRAVTRGGGQGRGIRRDAPIVAIAVEQGLVGQGIDVQIAAVCVELAALLRIAKHPSWLGRQRVGDGAGTRQQ